MKSAGRTAILATIVFSICAASSGQLSSSSSSNAVSTNSNVVSDTGTILPLVSMKDVPISAAIDNLCRQAGINFVVDRRLVNWWNYTDDFGRELHNEPVVNVHWTNITARAALLRLLGEHHLALAGDPQIPVVWVTYPNQTIAPADPVLLARNTNIVPLIQFEDVPITAGLENLAQQVPINYMLDPRLGYGMADENGNSKPEPELNLSWQNITAPQALAAVCENYGLVIIKDPRTGVFFVRANNHQVNFEDLNLPGAVTNVIPLIEFRNVPLTVAMENLVKQAHVRCLVDFRAGDTEPALSFRWENITAGQAIVAICENYNLTIVWDESTRSFQIKAAG